MHKKPIKMKDFNRESISEGKERGRGNKNEKVARKGAWLTLQDRREHIHRFSKVHLTRLVNYTS